MTIDNIQMATIMVANLIADGHYAGAIQACSSSRLTEADIDGVIRDYGRTFVRLPADYGDCLDAVRVEGRGNPTWSIRAPLWSREEGRSDLTLELTVINEVNGLSIELDDLKVI